MPWYQVTITTLYGKKIVGIREANLSGIAPFSYFSDLAKSFYGSYVVRGVEIEDLDSDDPRVLVQKRSLSKVSNKGI